MTHFKPTLSNILHALNRARPVNLVITEVVKRATPEDRSSEYSPQPSQDQDRIATVDILRALTMVLMIFVNDLWSLTNIPAWLGHVESGVDGIGLSDVVFPAFLFIVGLSIPFAIDNRIRKGDSRLDLIRHVLLRALALLVMGVFLVNGETINGGATGIPRYLWGPLCCLCFVLIWNRYPDKTNRTLIFFLRVAAIATLLILAIIYRGGPDGSLQTFGPQWWGILGLIGWSYLVSGLIAVYARNNFYIIAAAWAFFCVLSTVFHAGWVPQLFSFIPEAIRGGTLVGLTMGGVITSMIFRHFRAQQDNRKITVILLAFAAVLAVTSVLTRPYWGLSKLEATPAWLFLCSAFTVTAFVVLYWIVDVFKKDHWFDVVKPAGTATLLCYLIPHFAYFTKRLLGVDIPDFLLTGGPGLAKSFLFALLCVFITGLMLRGGVRMKI